MVNSDKSSKFIVSNYKIHEPFTAMFTDSKVIEIFCLADDFCKFFDSLTWVRYKKYTSFLSGYEQRIFSVAKSNRH